MHIGSMKVRNSEKENMLISSWGNKKLSMGSLRDVTKGTGHGLIRVCAWTVFVLESYNPPGSVCKSKLWHRVQH